MIRCRYGYGCDWWALGCVVYEMIAGHAPFGDQGDDSKTDIVQAIQAGRVSRIETRSR